MGLQEQAYLIVKIVSYEVAIIGVFLIPPCIPCLLLLLEPINGFGIPLLLLVHELSLGRKFEQIYQKLIGW